MLTNTFCHIPGIGPKYENRLWEMGFHNWHAALQQAPQSRHRRISPRRFAVITHHIRESVTQLEERNSRFFSERVPAEEHWRLFPEFRNNIAYLDIESTGTRAGMDSITTISLYDGARVRCYVKDRNIDEFPADIARYDLLVTYNGKCFDIPFLENAFGIRLDQAHIDLRYVLASLGFKGGLKGCERALGISRGNLDGVDGYFAILLWHDYDLNGNEKALETLLAYNIEDTVNLEALMITAYNHKIRRTPFHDRGFEIPQAPPMLYRADPATIHRLRMAFLADSPVRSQPYPVPEEGNDI